MYTCGVLCLCLCTLLQMAGLFSAPIGFSDHHICSQLPATLESAACHWIDSTLPILDSLTSIRLGIRSVVCDWKRWFWNVLLCSVFKIQMKAFHSFYETNTSYMYFRKSLQSPNFKICKEPRNWFQGIDSVSLCSLAGRDDNPFWRTDPPGYIGWRRNRSLGSLNR